MDWIDQKLRETPDSSLNAIGLLVGFVTFIIIAIVLIKTVVSMLSGTFSFSQISIGLPIAFLLLLVFCVWLIIKVLKYRKIQSETREVFSEGYYNLLKNYRNVNGEVLVAQNKEDNSLVIILDYIKSSLDILCDILNKLSRQKVSSCVKIIEPVEQPDHKLDYYNAKVYTFCRSSNSDPQRSFYDNNTKEDTFLIRDNTDFKRIVDPNGGLSCFYCPDLVALDEQLKSNNSKYENTNDYWEEYYRSTIVAPIRIANHRTPYNELDSHYTILGFLCIDSLSTHAFEPSQKAFYQYIVKSFAALLYTMLEMYKVEVEYLKSKGEDCNADISF